MPIVFTTFCIYRIEVYEDENKNLKFFTEINSFKSFQFMTHFYDSSIQDPLEIRAVHP